MRAFKLCFAIAVTALASLPVAADPAHAAGEPVTVVPGARYSAGGLYRLFFGGRWRDDWTTPLQVRTLDLGTFDGGLTATRRGGGLQTKNLRLKSADGRTWVFRSVDKDPTRMLDPELREAMAAELVRDTTSIAYPVAALVVAPLLEAVDVLHATPELVVIPDDPRLGEFREEFKGVLGMIELRPARGFAGAEKAMGTLELFARLDQRGDEQVDARSYLRARLIDLLVGDWDRHTDQWRWLRFTERGRRVWRPVPRDRDQAFSSFGGLVPSVAEYYTKQLTSFDDDYAPIDKLTFAGRYTDRRFLVPLERDAWQAVTADVVARLSDDVIATAVHRLPPELYARDGGRLEQALRKRRDHLTGASEAFYRLLAAEVDVYGTEQADRVAIRRAPDGAIELTLSDSDPDTGEAVAPPFFHRSFRPDETSEIRLYLLGGADRVIEEGERSDRILLRVVKGGPDTGGGTRAASRATVDELAFGESADAEPDSTDALRERYERYRDWGSDWLVFPQLSYDATRGLVAGARLQLSEYAFGRAPFADQMNFAAAWSTGLREPRLEYSLKLRTRSSVDVLAYVTYSGLDFANFYGFGNESIKDPVLQSRDFYKVSQHRLAVRSVAAVTLVGPLRGHIGGGFEYFDHTADHPSAASSLYGFGKMALASAELGIGLDTRAGSLTRRRGVEADATVQYYPPWLDNQAGFWKLRAEAATLLGTEGSSPALLRLRVAGQKVWGAHPFYESAFLGGAVVPSALDGTSGRSSGGMLRGYALNRFAGDASVVANTDLRIPIGRYSAILPLRYGLLGLADVGRVFSSGDSSSRWHWGAGGGVWLALRAAGTGFEYVSSTSLAVVRSDEGTSLYVLSSFGF